MLTGEDDAQQTVFYDQSRVGEKVLLFGAIHTENKKQSAASEVIGAEKANNYRRWWNNPWSFVEAGGPSGASAWTPEKMARLRALVERAHANGLWIRFYTLDGATEQEQKNNGWFRSYSFGPVKQAQIRWRSAIAAHVDYLASDQYELVGKEVHQTVVVR